MRADDPQFPQGQDAAIASEVTELLAVLLGRASADGTEASVPPSQLRALFAIERRAGGNLRALADDLGSSPPATSRLCDRLEAAGLVRRSVSPASRREVRLQLSRDGELLLDEVRARRHAEIAAVLGRMPDDSRFELERGLRAFREAATGGGSSGTGSSPVIGHGGDGHGGAAPSPAPLPAGDPVLAETADLTDMMEFTETGDPPEPVDLAETAERTRGTREAERGTRRRAAPQGGASAGGSARTAAVPPRGVDGRRRIVRSA